MFLYIWNKCVDNFSYTNLIIGTFSTATIAFVIYNEKNRIPSYQKKIEFLENSINDYQSWVGIEIISWELLLNLSLYKLYLNSEHFKEFVDFDKSIVDQKTGLFLESINKIEKVVDLSINSMFEKDKYYKYNSHNSLIMKNYSKLFFNQFRYLLEDQYINSIILNNHPRCSYLYEDGCPSLTKVLISNNFNVPFGYSNKFLEYNFTKTN